MKRQVLSLLILSYSSAGQATSSPVTKFLGSWTCSGVLTQSDHPSPCDLGSLALEQKGVDYRFSFRLKCPGQEDWSYSRRYRIQNGELWTFADPMTEKLLYGGRLTEVAWDAFHYNDDRLVHLGPVVYDGDSQVRWSLGDQAQTSDLDFDFKNLPPYSDQIQIQLNCRR